MSAPATMLCLFERNSNVRIFVPRGALLRRVKATAARFGYAGYFVGRARGGKNRLRVYSFCLQRPSEIEAILERPLFKWWRWHELKPHLEDSHHAVS